MKNAPAFPNTHPESGNVFIYIIGAIFLLGLLIVVMKGSLTPGSGIDQEELILKADQVRAHANDLERGVAYVMRNGHSETDIRFAANQASSAYGDIATDTPMSRQVFHVEGGGVEWKSPPSNIQVITGDWIFNASNAVDGVGTTCAGNSCVDLLAVLPNVTEEFCITLNEKAGVTNPSDAPPQDDTAAAITALFTGTFTYVQPIVDAGNNLQYKKEGCFEGGGTPATGTFHYYKVLLER